MVRPIVPARLEKENGQATLRINRGEICSFVTVAVVASIRQIFPSGLASMLFCDNVVRFMRSAYVCFMHAAIFTAATRPMAHLGPQSGRNPLGAHQAARKCNRACALTWVTRWS